MKKRIVVLFLVLMMLLVGCGVTVEGGTTSDTVNTKYTADTLAKNQPTPTDISYSLERYNLIRRAYWVNGHREKANTLICEIEKPLGYV